MTWTNTPLSDDGDRGDRNASVSAPHDDGADDQGGHGAEADGHAGEHGERRRPAGEHCDASRWGEHEVDRGDECREDEDERPELGFVVDVRFSGQCEGRRARDGADQQRRAPWSAGGCSDECADASGEVERHGAEHHESDDHRQSGDASLRPRPEQCQREPGDGEHRAVVEVGLAVDQESLDAGDIGGNGEPPAEECLGLDVVEVAREAGTSEQLPRLPFAQDQREQGGADDRDDLGGTPLLS